MSFHKMFNFFDNPGDLHNRLSQWSLKLIVSYTHTISFAKFCYLCNFMDMGIHCVRVLKLKLILKFVFFKFSFPEGDNHNISFVIINFNFKIMLNKCQIKRKRHTRLRMNTCGIRFPVHDKC